MTQKDLGDTIGVSKSTIGIYEQGQREPSISQMIVFANYFKVDMNYLYGWDAQSDEKYRADSEII